MHCFVLGTGGMMPLPRRRLTSVVVRPSSRMVQFDCGEGVQVAFKELRLGIKALHVVAVTHLHADHCLGLPGVLMFRSQCDDPGPLVVLGPRGIAQFVRHVIDDLSCHITFPIDVREWTPGADEVCFEDEELTIRWAPLVHGVVCLGYRLQERGRPGRFDPDRAKALGVRMGPLWGDLQRGETVTTETGSTVRPEQVLGPARRGRAVAYCTDTAPCENLVELCRDADVAFVEAMFLPEHEEDGRKKLHLTVLQSLEATKRAGAARTVLVHISPRYGAAELDEMLALVRGAAPSASIGKELSVIEIPLPE